MRKLNFSDIFVATRVIDNSGLRGEVTKLVRRIASGELDAKDLKNIGVLGILDALGVFARKETESAIMELLSGPFEMAADEVSALDLGTLSENLEQLVKDPGAADFFKRLSGILSRG